MVASTIDLVDQNEMLLRERRLKFALDDASGSYDACLIDCSPEDAELQELVHPHLPLPVEHAPEPLAVDPDTTSKLRDAYAALPAGELYPLDDSALVNVRALA